MDDSEVPVRNFCSGFVQVQNRELTDPAFFQIEDIVRKVILYKSGDDLTVPNFQRQSQSLPYTVIVPIHPQNGDMVLIQGEDISDIWYGHIHSTDYTRKIVDVYFFVESSRLENVFVMTCQKCCVGLYYWSCRRTVGRSFLLAKTNITSFNYAWNISSYEHACRYMNL